MEIDEGDDPRLEALAKPCPQCGYLLTPGMLGGGEDRMLFSLTCLSCGWSALVDPFA